MRSIVMHVTAVTLGIALAACAESRAPTAPARPSFAAGGRGPTVFVTDVSRDTTAQNETPVAANPTNPSNLLTAANDWNYNDGVAYNVSFDGGKTWSATLPNGFLPGLTRYTNDPNVPGTGIYDAAGDPAVAYGSDGTAYYAAQAFNFFTPPYQIALYVGRSTDGGLTWPDGVRQKPVPVSVWDNKQGKTKGSEGQFPDHESIAVDNNPNSPFSGSVYVTWVQFNGFGSHSPVQVAYSRDGARSFSAPVSVTQGPIRNNQDARIAIAPDGTLFLTFDNGIQGGKGVANYVSVSHDGGATWSTPFQFTLYNNPVCIFPPYCFNISGGPFRGPGSYPAPAFDATRNRLVVVYSDIDVDGLAKVFFASAAAGDVTHWSQPAVVAPGAGDRFGAEVGVAANGRVDVMFDDRSYSGNTLVDVTYAWSGDGGATWSSTRVTKSGFDPSQYGVPCGSCANGIRPFIGDYNGIASLSDHAVMTWTGVAPKTGTANDNLEIWFGSVTP
ncbi:MAG TPA: sialidase family protein [Gemmatimonadales bacterium]|nr:sialidase family protein [Gemmatimonadales bacterium]